jgi:hypothetical protein
VFDEVDLHHAGRLSVEIGRRLRRHLRAQERDMRFSVPSLSPLNFFLVREFPIDRRGDYGRELLCRLVGTA